MVFASSCRFQIDVPHRHALRKLIAELRAEGFQVEAQLRINDDPYSDREYIERLEEGHGFLYVLPIQAEDLILALEYHGHHAELCRESEDTAIAAD